MLENGITNCLEGSTIYILCQLKSSWIDKKEKEKGLQHPYCLCVMCGSLHPAVFHEGHTIHPNKTMADNFKQFSTSRFLENDKNHIAGDIAPVIQL